MEEDYDFSDQVSQSLLSLEQDDSQFRSDLDSSFSNLSGMDDADEFDKPVKKTSKFSKFRQNSGDGEKSVSDDASQTGNMGDDANNEEEVPKRRKTPKSNKKKRRRRDVVFKRILRECRRFFQTHLSELTGFVASKKPRTDDHFYQCMEKFNIEYLDLAGTFEQNFYLACLLYPQDLARNINIFIAKKEEPTKESQKFYKSIVAKIHDTLYKYSHEKLEYFVSIEELSNLFMYFYEHGAGQIRADPKLIEECEHIKSKCEEARTQPAESPMLFQF